MFSGWGGCGAGNPFCQPRRVTGTPSGGLSPISNAAPTPPPEAATPSGLGVVATPAPAPFRQLSPLGINLAGAAYYGSELPYRDIFRMSSAWIPQLVSGGPFDTGAPFAGFTAGGYPLLNPGQAACTLFVREIGDHYPGGTYICLYEGAGELQFLLDAAVAASSPGRITLNVTPGGGGITIRIIASDSLDPIRNIRVFRQSDESTYLSHPFRQSFLDRWTSYSTYRFMDWGNTNNSPVVGWSDRTAPEFYSVASARGVPLEVMIALCNLKKKDGWFCVPHLASDDYVAQMATLIRDTMDPDLHVYLEYSNECWNATFTQAAYCRTQGLAQSLGSDDFTAQLRFYSKRAVQIFEIFRSVFGGASSRLVRVLAAQGANTFTSETILDFQNAYQHADALAIAPYFSINADPSNEATIEAWTVDQVLAEAQAQVANQITSIAAHKAVATARGVLLLGYEAGQSFVGIFGTENNATIENLFHQANRDSRMGDLYATYLNGWHAAGGNLLMAFASMSTWTKFGSWGILENEDQTTSPKYAALEAFIAANQIV